MEIFNTNIIPIKNKISNDKKSTLIFMTINITQNYGKSRNTYFIKEKVDFSKL